jgi:hypothetical protein
MSDVEIDRPAAVADARGPRPRGRARYNRAMKFVRRAHLFAGLFMTPWVFLYGITALLFNHPDAFPDAKVIRFGRSTLAGTPLAEAPLPAALAARVVAAINTANAKTSNPTAYRLAHPVQAGYASDFFASAHGDGQEHFVRIDLARGKGTVSSQLELAENPVPFVTEGGVKLEPPPMEPLTRAVPGLLGRLGIPGAKAVDRSLPPDLSFLMDGDGRTWRVTYSLQNGQVSGRPETEARPISTRSYLLRLHVAHEYPSELGVRWFWAAAVDAMFLSMVGWGLTGLLMWWQMRSVRKVGIAVLVASVATAMAVAIGMHQRFTA